MNRLTNLAHVSQAQPADAQPIQRSGVKNRLLSREGLASVQDQKIYKKHLDNYNDALGSGGYSIKLVKANGEPIEGNNPLNIGGRIFYPNANGVYTFLDETVLEEHKKMNDEIEMYVDDLFDYSRTDESLATILRVAQSELPSICLKGANNVARYVQLVGKNVADNMPPDVLHADCLPSLLFLLHPHTREAALGVSKLRTLLKATMPIIQKQGTKKTLQEETN